MFLNFEDEEKELEHQYQIIAALEIIDYKRVTRRIERVDFYPPRKVYITYCKFYYKLLHSTL